MAMDKHWVPKKVSLIGQISLYLFPGIVLFIFAPAILFSYFEGWDYSISVYYTFVTLTTIGKFEHCKRTFMKIRLLYRTIISLPLVCNEEHAHKINLKTLISANFLLAKFK